jgi:peptidyl-prolyl cis-trans isomerase B (cyclophilin B)
MPKILAAAFALLASFAAAAASPQVELKTSMGIIVFELDPAKAPATVDNFLQYVKAGHYDGTIFHRVIPGFMVQGGGFTAHFVEEKPTRKMVLTEKSTRKPVRNEASNGLQNEVGTIAMARTPDPHSATAQFFINVADNRSLNFRFPTADGYGYTVFGKVVQGMDVVNRIVKVPTGPGPAPHQNVPETPIVIEQARILDAAAPAAKKK